MDLPNGLEGLEDDVEDEISGLDEGKHGSGDENGEPRPRKASNVASEDYVDDAGHILDGDKVDGTAGEGNGFGGDKEDD